MLKQGSQSVLSPPQHHSCIRTGVRQTKVFPRLPSPALRAQLRTLRPILVVGGTLFRIIQNWMFQPELPGQFLYDFGRSPRLASPDRHAS
jgi:hypothetical protein